MRWLNPKHPSYTHQHMVRLLTRTARPLTFLLVVPGENKKKKKTQNSPSSFSPISSSIGCVHRLLQVSSFSFSSSCPFLAWTLALAPGEFGLVRGDQHFRPRCLVAEEKREGLLLLSLQSKGALPSSFFFFFFPSCASVDVHTHSKASNLLMHVNTISHCPHSRPRIGGASADPGQGAGAAGGLCELWGRERARLVSSGVPACLLAYPIKRIEGKRGVYACVRVCVCLYLSFSFISHTHAFPDWRRRPRI